MSSLSWRQSGADPALWLDRASFFLVLYNGCRVVASIEKASREQSLATAEMAWGVTYLYADRFLPFDLKAVATQVSFLTVPASMRQTAFPLQSANCEVLWPVSASAANCQRACLVRLLERGMEQFRFHCSCVALRLARPHCRAFARRERRFGHCAT
jgi:hypothetical protein